MTASKNIVFALNRSCKSAYTALGAQSFKFILTARKDFMSVALMADIKNNLIGGAVEDLVQCNGKLNNAQI